MLLEYSIKSGKGPRILHTNDPTMDLNIYVVMCELHKMLIKCLPDCCTIAENAPIKTQQGTCMEYTDYFTQHTYDPYCYIEDSKDLLKYMSFGKVHKKACLKTPLPKHIAHFSTEMTDIMGSWMQRNRDHPYPSHETKKSFQRYTGLTMKQVDTWLINFRRRKMRNVKKNS